MRALAEAVGLVMNAAVAIWLSRTVGPEGLGYYAVTQTIIRIGGGITGGGMAPIGAQRVAQDLDRPERAWSVVTSVRLLLSVLAVLVVEVAVSIPGLVDERLRDLLRIAAPTWLFLAFSSEWLLVAVGQVLVVSASRVLSGITAVAIAVLLVRDPGDVTVLALIILVPAAVAMIVTLAASATRYLDLRWPAPTIWETIRSYRTDAFHYLKADLSLLIYNSADRLFLYVFVTPAVVGLYEAAYKLIQPFYAISVVISDSLFRRLAQARTSPTALQRATLRRFADLMYAATVPVGFFLTLFSGPIIELIYGARFEQAATYLALLGWVITVGYLGGAFCIPMIPWGMARSYSNALVAGNVVNLAANVVLIPPLLGAGAAIATILAKGAVAAVGYLGFRQGSAYSLLGDFLQYAAVSALALAAASTAQLVWGFWAGSMVTFAATYLGLAAVVRGRWYMSPSGTRHA